MHKLQLALLLIITSPAVTALEIGQGEKWQLSFSGFGTLGGVYSTDEDAGYIREISQLHGATGFSYDVDTRFGLQANLKLFDRIELVAQGVSRYRYDNSYNPELTMGFAKIEPLDGLTLRGGRLLSDFYMLSASRNIGYSYLTLRPPVDFFGPLFINYFDGGDMTYTLPLNENLLAFKAYLGDFSEKFPFRGALGSYESYETRSLFFGAHIEYLWDDWKTRISYAGLRIGQNPPGYDQLLFPALRSLPFPEAATIEKQLTFQDGQLNYYSAALSWNPSPFSVDLALAIVDSDIPVIPMRHSGFITLGYRIDAVTPFVSLSWALPISGNQTDRLPPTLPVVSGIINQSIDSVEKTIAFSRHTVSAGLRYDIMTNVDAKFQVDFVQGDATGLLWESIPARSNAFDGNTVVFGTALDFVF